MTGSAEKASAPSDAWTYALELSRPYFAAPAARELPIDFAVEATRIGGVVRAVHERAAGNGDDDSQEEPAMPEDLDAWVAVARTSVDSGLALLERQLSTAGFAAARVAEAQALVKRRTTYLTRIDALADSLGEDLGMLIRTRGDLSLNAVTRAANGDYSITGGLGEASNESGDAERRTSPLRDVASMLRSVGSASATLLAEVERTSDMATRELRAGRWEREVRAGFVEGYTVDADDDAPGILPEEPESVAAMIALFETEKAFADLSHALRERPASAWIPMRGIAKLLAW